MKKTVNLLLFFVITGFGAFCQAKDANNDVLDNYTVAQLKAALKKADAAVKETPGNPDSYNERAAIRHRLNDLPGALADYDQALALKKDNTAALVNRGVLRRDLGNAEGAMNDFETAIRYNRRLPEAYNNKAFLLYSSGKVKESIPYFDTALALKPDYRNAYNNEIEALITLKRFPEAATACGLLMAHFPGNPVNYIHRASLYQAQGQLIPALEDYDRAVELSKYKPDIVLERAKFKDDGLNDHKGAVKDCDLIIQSNPALSEAWFYRARAEYSLQQYDRTIEDCNKAIALNPRRADVYTFRGNAYDLSGDGPRALKDYDSAINIDRKRPEPYLEKSGTLLMSGDSAAALKVLEAYSVANDKPHSDIFLKRGVLKIGKGRFAEAKKDLEQVIEMDPNSLNGYYYCAIAHDSLHDKKSACGFMIKAWRLGDTDSSFRYVKTFCRGIASAAEIEVQEQMLQSRDNQEKGKLFAAMANCNRVIALMPDSAVGYYNRGKLNRGMENHEEAIKDYLHAIRLDSTITPAYIAAAVSYYYLRDMKSARAYYAAALKTDPGNAMCYYNLGRMAHEENNYKEAIDFYKKAVNSQYNYPKAWLYLGDCYKETGEKDNACFSYLQAEGLGELFAKVQRMNLCK